MKKQFILKSIITLALLGSFWGCETISEHCQNNPFDASCPKSSSSDGKNRDENGNEMDGLGKELDGATAGTSQYRINNDKKLDLKVIAYEGGYKIDIKRVGDTKKEEAIKTCENGIGHYIMQDGNRHIICKISPDNKTCMYNNIDFCGPIRKTANWEIKAKETTPPFDPKKSYSVVFDCFNQGQDEITIDP